MTRAEPRRSERHQRKATASHVRPSSWMRALLALVLVGVLVLLGAYVLGGQGGASSDTRVAAESDPAAARELASSNAGR